MKGFLSFAFVLFYCISICRAGSLGTYNIDRSQITIAGISSGGFQAVQVGVSFSATFKGVAVMAGGPYFCAQNNLLIANSSCTIDPQNIDVAYLAETTKSTADYGYADPVDAIKSQKIWLLSGTQDHTLFPGVMKRLEEYYLSFTSKSNIQTVFDIPAEHSWITADFGSQCDYNGSPYMNKCGFDAQESLLTWLYGNLNPQGTPNKHNIISFDQSAFIPADYTAETASIYDTGYAYVPTTCRDKKLCKLVVALHGCLMSPPYINTTFVEHSGLNGWAESNDIIVLYPQVMATLLNPDSCWDWWGYTGPAYASNIGAQPSFIHNIVQHIAGETKSSSFASKVRGARGVKRN